MSLRMALFAGVALGAVTGLSGAALAESKKEVEIVHWWTSGGEAAGLEVLRKDVEAKGTVWKDSPIACGGVAQAMTVLQARITARNPPTASQMLGFDVQDWAEQGVLGNLNSVAAAEGWDKSVPAALQRFSK